MEGEVYRCHLLPWPLSVSVGSMLGFAYDYEFDPDPDGKSLAPFLMSKILNFWNIAPTHYDRK